MPCTHKDLNGKDCTSKEAAIENNVAGIGQCSLGGYTGTSGSDILRRYRNSGATLEQQAAFAAELRAKYRP